MKYCVNCGTKMADDDKFCPSCGAKSNEYMTDVAAASAPQHPAAPEPEAYASQQTPPQPAPQAAAYPQQPTPRQPEPSPVYPQQQTPSQYGQAAPQPTPGQPGPRPAYPQQPVAPSYSGANQAQPAYAPQPRTGDNPYARFSGAMNTGNIQRKTSSRGLLIGGIIALIILAAIIAAVILFFGKPPAEKPADLPSGNNASVNMPSGSGSSQQNNNQSALPDTGKIKKDARLDELIGTWTGEYYFTRFEGYESLPADELPDDFQEIVSDLLSSPSPVEFYVSDSGHWEIYIDVMTGMMFDSYEYDYEIYETSPMLIELENGKFDISYTEDYTEEYGYESSGSIKLYGSVTEDSDGLHIAATFQMTFREDDIYVVQEGNFVISPES